MRLSTTALFSVLVYLAAADKHDYCACQRGTDAEIFEAVTALVASDCSLPYVYAQKDDQFFIAQGKEGARYQGKYLKVPNGKIDGDDFYNICRHYGALDSTCFNCNAIQDNLDGSLQCRDGDL